MRAPSFCSSLLLTDLSFLQLYLSSSVPSAIPPWIVFADLASSPQGMLACLSLFPAEKQLFFHEFKTSARHSVATFVLAYTLQETIVSLISSLVRPIFPPSSLLFLQPDCSLTTGANSFGPSSSATVWE